METLNKIHNVVNELNEDPRINISKKDDYNFKVVITGNLMSSFEKLGEVQNKILENCDNKYDLKTVYGDGQDATFILEKTQ